MKRYLDPNQQLHSGYARKEIKLAGMHRQGGAILVFGLVLLLAITVLGSSTVQDVMLEEKMNANQLNAQLAFHGADTALIECESFIRDSNVVALVSADAVVELNDYESESGNWWTDSDFWKDKTQADVIFERSEDNPAGLAAEPACVTEFIGTAGASKNWDQQVAGAGFDATEKLYYRVTAYSAGATTKSSTVLETIYAK